IEKKRAERLRRMDFTSCACITTDGPSRNIGTACSGCANSGSVGEILRNIAHSTANGDVNTTP
ncbi:MAG: hypothetical protein KDA69_17265, partial [Planctomycetaceae bacterium]|nr:hypothetical protein [Planctomycetaceae bacterium]